MLNKGMLSICKIVALLIAIPHHCILPKSISAQTHQEVGVALSQPLTVRWVYSSDLTTNLTPGTDGERVYLPLASGMIISLNAQDGQLIWKTELGGEISSSPTADERGVYVASEATNPKSSNHPNGAIRAIGKEGGITLWRRTLPMPIHGSLISNKSYLFGGSSDGRVYAIKKQTGDIAWTLQHSAPFASQPTLFGASLYIGSDDGQLFSLDQLTGRTHWRYRTRGAIQGRAILFQGLVYFGSADGYVYAVDEMTGRLRWRRRTGASVQTVAFAQSGILATSLDNFVYCFSFIKGAQLWKRQLAGRIAAAPLTAPDGALFTPLSSSIGVVLDLRDGKQLNSLPIGEDNDMAASPIVAGNLLFLTTRHGLFAFSRPS